MTINKDAGREEFELSDEEVALILSAGMNCTERETKLALQELRDGSPDTIKIMAGIRAVIAADCAKRIPPDTVPRSELEAYIADRLAKALKERNDALEPVAELQAKAVPDVTALITAFHTTESGGDDGYVIKLRFPDIQALHKADRELMTMLSAAPALLPLR